MEAARILREMDTVKKKMRRRLWTPELRIL
jgi:hypothetical protein